MPDMEFSGNYAAADTTAAMFAAAAVERNYDAAIRALPHVMRLHGVHSVETAGLRNEINEIRLCAAAVEQSGPAEQLLDAFCVGGQPSRQFAGRLAVRYALNKVLPVRGVSRTLRRLLFDPADCVAMSAAGGMGVLRARALELGPYDELTWQCLKTPRPNHSYWPD